MTDTAYQRLGLPETASPYAVLRAARKRFYRQMLCAHAARQAANDAPSG